MSEEEIIKDIKAYNFTEEDVKEILHDLEVDNGNYSNYDLAMAIMFYKDLYNKEKAKNKKALDFINDENNYFEDGENWQNVLKIKHLLEEDNK